jgi:hypothetical protein
MPGDSIPGDSTPRLAQRTKACQSHQLNAGVERQMPGTYSEALKDREELGSSGQNLSYIRVGLVYLDAETDTETASEVEEELAPKSAIYGYSD